MNCEDGDKDGSPGYKISKLDYIFVLQFVKVYNGPDVILIQRKQHAYISFNAL